MTLVTIGDYTFNPEAIDLVKGDGEDYCEVFFRNGRELSFTCLKAISKAPYWSKPPEFTQDCDALRHGVGFGHGN